MAQCKEVITISTTYGCAVFCDKWNEPPLAKLKYFSKGYRLLQDCVFYDSKIIQNRKFRWNFKCKDFLIYQTSWGGLNDFIPEMGNGSTYGAIRVGVNNTIIINFLNSLPTTIINTDELIIITIETQDCDGITNAIESNKYKFNKK